MKLSEYLAEEHGAASRLAQKLGIAPPLLSQWKTEERQVPIDRCPEIEVATNRAVMRWDLRPTDWHRIWPELVKVKGAPAIPEASNAQ